MFLNQEVLAGVKCNAADPHRTSVLIGQADWNSTCECAQSVHSHFKHVIQHLCHLACHVDPKSQYKAGAAEFGAFTLHALNIKHCIVACRVRLAFATDKDNIIIVLKCCCCIASGCQSVQTLMQSWSLFDMKCFTHWNKPA